MTDLRDPSMRQWAISRGLVPATTPRHAPHRQHHSAAGELLLLQLRGLGVEGVVAEYRFHAVRRWRFDAAIPAHKIAVEVDGGAYVNGRHSRGAGVEADCEKLCHAVVDGWRVLRVTPRQVRRGEAATWVLQALGHDRRTP